MKEKFSASSKIENIPEALSIYINQIVYSEKRAGMDIITLSLGEAFFEIPSFSFSEIDFVKGYHYSDSMGLPELREKIRNYYNKHYGTHLMDIDEIMISSGSKAIIYMVMESVLEQKDEVLIHEPAWLSYQEQAKLAGAEPKFIPYDCTPEKFLDYFTDQTKLLILNNPNNPSGLIYSLEQLKYLCEICFDRGIYILMDEAYSDFVDEENEFYSLASVTNDMRGIFIVNSLSKNMGMSGWRVGYVISHKDNIANILKLNQHLITCAPTVLQLYLARYFEDIIDVTMPQVKEVVSKRKRILDYIDSIGLSHLNGSATFYIFLKVEGLLCDTLDFCLYLLFKYGIATVPGSAYGENTDKFIRVGIGAESEERIYYALDVISMVLKENLVDTNYVSQKLKKNRLVRFERSNNGNKNFGVY